jgi:Protein of unknown function (DUF2924)
MEMQMEVSMVPASSSNRSIKRRRIGGNPEDVAREVASLGALDAAALKQKWLALYRAEPPPRLRRSLMIRAIAHRIQERTLGGLKPATRRFLSQFTNDAAAGRTLPPRSRAVNPDTVLVREWHGTSHRVTVLERGFDWRGKRYRSLSEIARAITGTRWSGPRFFGIKQLQEESRNGARHD